MKYSDIIFYKNEIEKLFKVQVYSFVYCKLSLSYFNFLIKELKINASNILKFNEYKYQFIFDKLTYLSDENFSSFDNSSQFAEFHFVCDRGIMHHKVEILSEDERAIKDILE